MRPWIIGIAALLLWSAGSTYWYVCRVKGLCWTDDVVSLAAAGSNSGKSDSNDTVLKTEEVDSAESAAVEMDPASSENGSDPVAAISETDDKQGSASSSNATSNGDNASKSASSVGAPAGRTILFAFATPQMGDASLGSYLDGWASFLKSNPGKKVRLRGYTDDTAARENNLKLAQRRCDAIAALLRERGVGETQIVTEPLGEADPVATNDTPEGRTRNRRVVISLNE